MLLPAHAAITGNSDPRPTGAHSVIVDFKKVNWNAAGLAPYAPTLLTRAATIQRPLGALKVYFRKTCKLDV